MEQYIKNYLGISFGILQAIYDNKFYQNIIGDNLKNTINEQIYECQILLDNYNNNFIDNDIEYFEQIKIYISQNEKINNRIKKVCDNIEIPICNSFFSKNKYTFKNPDIFYTYSEYTNILNAILGTSKKYRPKLKYRKRPYNKTPRLKTILEFSSRKKTRKPAVRKQSRRRKSTRKPAVRKQSRRRKSTRKPAFRKQSRTRKSIC